MAGRVGAAIIYTPCVKPCFVYIQWRIAHRETGEYSARMVESSKPVVTGWDRSPPDREQRAVGTWDVTPTPDGVSVTNVDRMPVPEDVEAQLRKEAEQTGDVAARPRPCGTTTTWTRA